ncbi:MAG: tetratricopeptide repeat protein, partial [Planctomycetota bacterium]
EIMGIANVAHGVGGLLGFGTGWAMSPPRSNVPRFWQRVSTPARWGAVGSLFLLLLLAATVGRSRVNLSPFHQRILAVNKVFGEGYEALGEGDFQQAIESFSEVVARDDSYKEAWFNLGLARGRSGDYAEALRAFDRALEIDPMDAEFREYRESFLEELERSKGNER